MHEKNHLPAGIFNASRKYIHLLFEALLVLLLILMIFIITAPRLASHPNKAKLNAAKAQLEIFNAALASFQKELGYYPSTTAGLDLLNVIPATPPEQWNGPYLKTHVPNDPWNNPYIYTFPGTHNPDAYDLFSMGPDGTRGTADDITNWPVGGTWIGRHHHGLMIAFCFSAPLLVGLLFIALMSYTSRRCAMSKLVFLSICFFTIPITFASERKEKIPATKAQLSTFDTALDMYQTDMGDYPTTTEGLEKLNFIPKNPPKSWNGPYLKSEVPPDAWNRPYRYLRPGTHNPQTYDIASAGPDGIFDTADDIANYPVAASPSILMNGGTLFILGLAAAMLIGLALLARDNYLKKKSQAAPTADPSNHPPGGML